MTPEEIRCNTRTETKPSVGWLIRWTVTNGTARRSFTLTTDGGDRDGAEAACHWVVNALRRESGRAWAIDGDVAIEAAA